MRTRSRRAVLGSLASAGAVLTAGCLFDTDSVSVLAAGSLAAAFETLGQRFQSSGETAYHGEYHGSNAVVRMVEDRTKHPDVVVSADVELLRSQLRPEYASWDIVFAGNELGIAYNPQTDLGERLDAGERPWYELLADASAGAVAISDPDLDPLGYRAVQMLTLAEEYYDVDGLRESVLESAQFEADEPRLLADLETGNRAAAIAYRNMAVDRDLPFLDLPPQLNFADPTLADHYAQATYTTDDGYTAAGSPILYNTTVLDEADNAAAGREFVGFLLDHPDLLREAGLGVPKSVPRGDGSVPDLPTEAQIGGAA
jgi:molybdate/tungstate transport system substrate-binding protein